METKHLTYEGWHGWFDCFSAYPELNDMRLKVMLTLIVVKPNADPVTHSDLQQTFKLTDKTIRGLRRILLSKGWTEESFVDRNIIIRPTDRAISKMVFARSGA